MESIQRKKEIIKRLEKKLNDGEYLIFKPPIKDCLYTNEEILYMLKDLKKLKIGTNLSTVQKSHFIKYWIIDKLGYDKPLGLRIKQAKLAKPKFLNQLLDVFVQKSNNLQVWNYIPYDENVLDGKWNTQKLKYSDCRYLIIKQDSSGNILKYFIKSGKDLAKWDTTGAHTIKWQANVPLHLRKKSCIICSYSNMIFENHKTANLKIKEKMAMIRKMDTDPSKPLIKTKPNFDTLYTNSELCELLSPLIRSRFSNLGAGQERIFGQNLEKIVTKSLGYLNFSQTDTGGFPDLLHQLIEIKFQFSGTIDLGKNLPTDPRPIDEYWNDWGLTNQHIRYCIFLMAFHDGEYHVQSIVVVSGKDFPEYFNICAGTNFKVQMIIPSDEFS